MGSNRFWIGGYDTDGIIPTQTPWLLAPTAGGAPYLCCRCPCVSYYAVFAFRAILLTGAQHDVLDYCTQSATHRPLGVATDGTVRLDSLYLGEGVQGAMAIDPDAGIYDECGRATISTTSVTQETIYYEVRAYRISQKYACYDEFREACFGHCTSLPCDEYDPQTNECTHHYLPDSAYVFDGTARPWYGRTSSAYSQYGCSSYWESIATSRYWPRITHEWGAKQVSASVVRDAYDCMESRTMRTCMDWDGQGNCIAWDEWEDCVRLGLYAVGCTIDGTTSYYTLIWDGTGTQPERTAARNVAWLQSGLESAVSAITAAKGAQPAAWADSSSTTTYSDRLCSSWSVGSAQYCQMSYSQAYGKTWLWQAGRFRAVKPSYAPSTATGARIRIKTTVRHYDGTYTPTEDPTWQEPNYTQTVSTETRDMTFGAWEVLTPADGLTVAASATACDSGANSAACITPCADLPHDEVEYDVSVIDYIYGGSSSSSASGGI